MRLPIFVSGLLLLVTGATFAAPPQIEPVAGLRERTPRVQAIVNARVVQRPGKVIENGRVLIRDGVIVAVGEKIDLPPEARVWDLQGKTVYPGFVDAFTEQQIPADKLPSAARHWSKRITPELELAAFYQPEEALHTKYRAQGITARLVAPAGGIIKGQSALVLNGGVNRPTIVHGKVAQHIRLTVPFGVERDEYPNSPMGAVALARQTMLDAQWYRQASTAAAANTLLPRLDANRSLDALLPAIDGTQLVIADASDEQFLLRADAFAREFGLKLAIRGIGREYRLLELVKKTGRTIIVPVSFPQPPNVDTLAASLDVSLEQLMHWDLAPENPARLVGAGVPIALTTYGLTNTADFLSNVRRAVQRGLSADAALQALTLTPAELLGAEKSLGSIEPGKLACLVVADGDLFATKTKLLETWVEGQRYELQDAARVDIRGRWQLEFSDKPGKFSRVHLALSGTAEKPSGKWSLNEELEKADKLTALKMHDAVVEFSFDGKPLDLAGVARASGVVAAGKENELRISGEVIWADGSHSKLTGKRTSPFREGEAPAEPKGDKKEEESDKEKPKDKTDSPAVSQVNFPLGDFGLKEIPEQHEMVAIKNATIWTAADPPVIENGVLLIRAGKIVAVGKEQEIPEGITVIDAKGKHISPGIIDCHSHMATDGGVNEAGQSITAEVRIGDFVDANDITIYRQLAGGVTAANILHGSANTIGGQNQVIKLRWGSSYEGLRFREAPAGIKFALGENVKQSNWGEKYTKRYPQSRMGVEQILQDAMVSAKDYRRRLQLWKQNHEGLPPRRDLELDALVEVIEGTRLIHCHSYRQDEILALLQVCEQHGVQVATLQHILEGYKVADAIARHGAAGSSFSDWWGYKFEVLDAIPHNGLLMHRAGVSVSFNSDDRELARHLNHEAAKAMKYGGVPEVDALKFVTLNPAKQLRIDKYVGSLEAGKHADFVIWNGPPLSTLARCEQTWIEGRKFFDRAADVVMRKEQDQLRAAIIRKILASGESMKKAGDKNQTEADLWPREDEYCAHSRGQ
ncbi:amidohydrolase family protein [Anatilimnocola floriformis]|uniref:amidohydrolase family protein n=1 Tax=Anatilimnocola floriformis TaxID=2948575 RepID=UPI0020C2FE35|nr:amidohydrolase family protein [Anatilimnocola floriformis]